MRTLTGIGLAAFLAGTLCAEHRGFARNQVPRSSYGSRHGFGNVVFPGTGRPPVAGHPLSITDPSFARRLGATVSGWPPYTGVSGPGRRTGVVYYPYVWPAYGGGFTYPYPQQPNVIVIQQPSAPPQQPAPQVIIQNFATPAESDTVSIYQAPSRKPVETSTVNPEYYLIAFKDNTIYSALGYWIEGDTLHYLTSGNVRNQVSLELVDEPLTERLNKDRGVDVKLRAR
jgi:hypothetical protein